MSGTGWEGTISRAAIGAITAFAMAAIPTYVGVKSTQDLHEAAIGRIDEKVKEMDRGGTRGLDLVKAKVDGLDKKIDELVDLVRSQNDLLWKKNGGR